MATSSISTSGIDTTKPVSGSPTTQSVRDNFVAIKTALNTAATEIGARLTQSEADSRYVQPGDISGLGTGDMLGEHNLSEITDAAEARGNLGLGDSATRNVGTTSGTVADGTAPDAAVTARLSASGDGTPAMDGAAARGTSSNTARADHVHPTDTSRAPMTLVGTPTAIQFACSDESTALATGTGKITLRAPHAMTLTAVRASLTVAQSSGSIFTVDINVGGTSILSTKLTIDNTEKTSTTAATAAVISSASISDDAEISVDIDQIGDGTAKGLKVTLIGTRT